MKRILFAIPMLALLCGCAGFTGDMLRQDVQIGVGVIRAVSCSVAVNGGFGSPYHPNCRRHCLPSLWRNGCEMISAWWLVPAIVAGVVLGIIVHRAWLNLRWTDL
jgi:hypothetical protein